VQILFSLASLSSLTLLTILLGKLLVLVVAGVVIRITIVVFRIL